MIGQKIPVNDFKFKKCLVGATNIRKNSEKSRFVYTGNWIACDSESTWDFGYDFATNGTIFGVYNSWSSHADNRINNFLVLGEGPTYDIKESFCEAEKKFSNNFNKTKTKLCLSLHYNSDNSYLFLNGKEIYKFKLSFA